MVEKRRPCAALVVATLTSVAFSSTLVAQSVFPVRLDGQAYTVEAVVNIPPANGESVDPQIVSMSSDNVVCGKTPVFESALLQRCRDDDGCVLRMAARKESSSGNEVSSQLPATLAFDTNGRWKSMAIDRMGNLEERQGQMDNQTEESVLSFHDPSWICILQDDHLFAGPVFTAETFALFACGNSLNPPVDVGCTLRIDD